jgi:hypothetical protein
MAEKEYIERDSIYSRVKAHTNPYGKPTLDYESGVKVLDMIKQEPAADVVEVVHGEWIDRDEKTWCSKCDASNKQYKPPYCPHCGAKMDGERKEETP